MKRSRRQFLAATGAVLFVGGCGGTGPVVRDDGTWGRSGLRNGEFRRPRAIGVHDDEVYVIDTTGRVQVFSLEGEFRRGWRTPAFENGTPTGITFTGDGRVVVPDTHYSSILEYSASGELLDKWGSYGTGDDQFIYPTDIAIDVDGTMYISEFGTGAERVHVFDRERNFLRKWGAAGEQPGYFARAMSLLCHEGFVYVSDTGNHRVQCFTTQGRLIRIIGGAGSSPGRLKFPHDIAIAPDGSLIVCEYGNNRLSRLTTEGDCVSVFGGPGRGPAEFNTPRGVAVSAGGLVFVADTDNDRVQRFRLEELA